MQLSENEILKSMENNTYVVIKILLYYMKMNGLVFHVITM